MESIRKLDSCNIHVTAL